MASAYRFRDTRSRPISGYSVRYIWTITQPRLVEHRARMKAVVKFGDGGELVKCSFCGKPNSQVKKLVAGPGVYICDECVDLCVSVLEMETSPTEPPKPSPAQGARREVGGWDAARQGATRNRSLFERIREKSDELLMIPDLPSSAASVAEALKHDAVLGAASASFLEQSAERVTRRRQPRKEINQGDEPS